MEIQQSTQKAFFNTRKKREVKIAIMLLILELDVFVIEDQTRQVTALHPCNSEYHSSSEHT